MPNWCSNTIVFYPVEENDLVAQGTLMNLYLRLVSAIHSHVLFHDSTKAEPSLHSHDNGHILHSRPAPGNGAPFRR